MDPKKVIFITLRLHHGHISRYTVYRNVLTAPHLARKFHIGKFWQSSKKLDCVVIHRGVMYNALYRVPYICYIALGMAHKAIRNYPNSSYLFMF